MINSSTAQRDNYELLAPVSTRAMLTAAIDAGADAVYFGLKQLNMRASAHNFELSQLHTIVAYCHQHTVKAYITLNVITFDNEYRILNTIAEEAARVGIDGIICWDPAVINVCIQYAIPLHISTQASVSNIQAARFYADRGARQIVLARECTLEQIHAISTALAASHPDVIIEAFIHGALCVAVSGRCFLSQFLFNRSANRGDCIQPCRRRYTIVDPDTGNELLLSNHHVMSAKDICTLPFLPQLISAGIRSFKIEGRAKDAEYVKVVTGAYRAALDAIARDDFTPALSEKLVQHCKTVFNRTFSNGFYFGRPDNHDFAAQYGSAATRRREYIGTVRKVYRRINVMELKLVQSGLSTGDTLVIIGPHTGAVESIVRSIEIEHHNQKHARKGEIVGVKIDCHVRKNDKVFLIVNESPLIEALSHNRV